MTAPGDQPRRTTVIWSGSSVAKTCAPGLNILWVGWTTNIELLAVEIVYSQCDPRYVAFSTFAGNEATSSPWFRG